MHVLEYDDEVASFLMRFFKRLLHYKCCYIQRKILTGKVVLVNLRYLEWQHRNPPLMFFSAPLGIFFFCILL